MSLRVVLFDLDGTLLDNDMDAFLTAFLQRFAPHVAHRIVPDVFVPAWLSAMQVMLHNTDLGLTNQDVFDLSFYPRVGVLRDELLPSIQAFYATSYRSLRSLTRPKPGARETLQATLDAGLDVAIATNPIFPATAVQQRLDWAGVADLPLALVTSSENMHASKPNQQYYREILDHMQRQPDECLMVGDDFVNDIQPCTRLGLHTYWVDVAATTPPNFDPSARGRLHQFHAWLASTGLIADHV